MGGRSISRGDGGLGLCGYLNLAARRVVGVEELPWSCVPDRRHRPTDVQTRPCCASTKRKQKKKKKTVDRQTGEINPQQRKKCVSKRWITTTRPCRAHHLGCRPHCWDRDLCAVSSSEANGTCRRPPARARTRQDGISSPAVRDSISHHTNLSLPSMLLLLLRASGKTRTGNDFWWLSK